MLYIVYYADGSVGIFTEEVLVMLLLEPQTPGYEILYYEPYDVAPTPADITISAPDSAGAGEVVPVTAKVKNVEAYDHTFKTEIWANETLLRVIEGIIRSGLESTYSTSFTMPAADVTILVWVERWVYDHYVYSNAASKTISLTVAPPPPVPHPADIVGISAPASAPSGETVIVDVSVKNINAYDRYISVTAVYDGTWIPFQFDYLLVAPGQTVVMRGWFTMPSKDVRVTAGSFHWDGSTWVLDDTVYVDIALTVVPTQPEFKAGSFAISEYNRV